MSTTFMQWLAALRADADRFGFGARVDIIPMWMLERVYQEGTDATVEQILLYCETEAGRNFLLEQHFENVRKPSQSIKLKLVS